MTCLVFFLQLLVLYMGFWYQVTFCGGHRPEQVDSRQPPDPEEPLAARRGDPQPESLRNPLRALQAGRDLDRCQSQLHLRLSRQDHFHLPHEVQRVPHGHTEVQVSGRPHNAMFKLGGLFHILKLYYSTSNIGSNYDQELPECQRDNAGIGKLKWPKCSELCALSDVLRYAHQSSLGPRQLFQDL